MIRSPEIIWCYRKQAGDAIYRVTLLDCVLEHAGLSLLACPRVSPGMGWGGIAGNPVKQGQNMCPPK